VALSAKELEELNGGEVSPEALAELNEPMPIADVGPFASGYKLPKAEAPAPPAPSGPTFWDKAVGVGKGVIETMGSQIRAMDRAAAQSIPIVGGFVDNIKGGINAAGQAVQNAISDKPGKAPGKVYDETVSGERALDDKAASEHPGMFYGTRIGLGFASPPLSSVVKGAGTLPAMARAALAGGEGAVDAAGLSNRDDAEGMLDAAKKGAVVPVGLHGVAAVAGKVGQGVGWLAGKVVPEGTAGKSVAERAGDQMLALSVVHGADQTAAKRAVGTPEQVHMVADLARRDPALRAAIRAKDPHAMVEHTDRILEEAGPQTAPVYQIVDRVLGEIRPADVVRVVDDEIAAIRKTPGRSAEEGRIPGLEAIRERMQVIGNAKPNRAPVVKDLAGAQERAKALRFEATDLRSRGPASAKRADELDAQATRIIEDARRPELEQGTLTTKDLRAEVTGLLKQKFRTMGSIAETSGYAHKADNHDLLNRFLNERLAAAGAIDPKVAEEVSRLRHVNRDIAAALNIQNAAESSIARSARQAKGVDDIAGDAVGKGVLRAGAGAMLAGPAGAAAAVAPYAVKQGVRAGAFALADFAARVRLARAAGQPVPADAIAAALAAGVPRAFVQAVVKAQQNESPPGPTIH
jgi:hypothetical protein